MSLFDLFKPKVDANEVYHKVAGGLSLMVADWQEQFNNEPEKFNQFITHETTIGYMIGFSMEVCLKMELRNGDDIVGVIASSMRESIGKYFTSLEHYLEIFDEPFDVVWEKVRKGHVSNPMKTGSWVVYEYFNFLGRSSPRYFMTRDGTKRLLDDKFYYMIADAPKNFSSRKGDYSV